MSDLSRSSGSVTSMTSAMLQKIGVPPGAGTVRSRFRGTGRRAVVLIQDAHGAPEAQESIREMIRFFNEYHGISLVALEGAQGSLDPFLFRTFPDAEILAGVFGDYGRAGELSGAAMASVLGPPGIEFLGVERWPIYEENVLAMNRALSNKGILEKELRLFGNDLEKLKKQYYPPNALQADSRIVLWESGKLPLTGLLLDLAALRNPDKRDYPDVSAMLEVLRREESADKGKIDREIHRLAALLESRPLTPEKQKAWAGKKQAWLTGRAERREVAAYLVTELERVAVPRGQKDIFGAEIRQLAADQVFLERLQGEVFVREFEAYLKDLLDLLLKSGPAKTINGLAGELRDFGKLVRFELTFNQWRGFEKRRGLLSVPGDKSRESGLKTPDPEDPTRELREKFCRFYLAETIADFIRFYEIAGKRNRALAEGTLKALRERHADTCILVAGGFHSEEILRMLKAEGISYLEISPRMDRVPEASGYLDSMRGRVSWKDYFQNRGGRIDLYEAFTRAAVDRLLEKSLEKPGGSGIAKTWRDEIIRRLAGQGKLDRAGRYTGFLDQAMARDIDAARLGSLKSKWTERLEKFVSGLRALEGGDRMTEANIANLFGPATLQTFTAVASLVPGSRLSTVVVQARSDEVDAPSALSRRLEAGAKSPPKNGPKDQKERKRSEVREGPGVGDAQRVSRLVAQAQDAIRAHHFEDALRLLQDAERIDPRDGDMLVTFGQLYAKKDEPGLGVRYLEMALAQITERKKQRLATPEWTRLLRQEGKALNFLAINWSNLGSPDKGIQVIQEAMEKDHRNNYLLKNTLAKLYRETGRIQDFLDLYGRREVLGNIEMFFIRDDLTTDAYARVMFAEELIELGRPNDGIRLLGRRMPGYYALGDFINSPETRLDFSRDIAARMTFALLLDQIGEHAEAINFFVRQEARPMSIFRLSRYTVEELREVLIPVIMNKIAAQITLAEIFDNNGFPRAALRFLGNWEMGDQQGVGKSPFVIRDDLKDNVQAGMVAAWALGHLDLFIAAVDQFLEVLKNKKISRNERVQVLTKLARLYQRAPLQNKTLIAQKINRALGRPENKSLEPPDILGFYDTEGRFRLYDELKPFARAHITASKLLFESGDRPEALSLARSANAIFPFNRRVQKLLPEPINYGRIEGIRREVFDFIRAGNYRGAQAGLRSLWRMEIPLGEIPEDVLDQFKDKIRTPGIRSLLTVVSELADRAAASRSDARIAAAPAQAGFVDALMGQVWTALHSEDFESAQKALREALSRDPDRIELLLLAGQLFTQWKGHRFHEEAVGHVQHGLELIRHKKEDLRQRDMTDSEMYRRVHSGEGKALNYLARLWEQSAKPAQGITLLEQALNEGDQAGNLKLINTLSVLYKRTGQIEKVIERYGEIERDERGWIRHVRMRSKFRKNTYARVLLADALGEIGRPEDGLLVLGGLKDGKYRIGYFPDDSDLWELSLNQVPAARVVFAKLLGQSQRTVQGINMFLRAHQRPVGLLDLSMLAPEELTDLLDPEMLKVPGNRVILAHLFDMAAYPEISLRLLGIPGIENHAREFVIQSSFEKHARGRAVAALALSHLNEFDTAFGQLAAGLENKRLNADERSLLLTTAVEIYKEAGGAIGRGYVARLEAVLGREIRDAVDFLGESPAAGGFRLDEGLEPFADAWRTAARLLDESGRPDQSEALVREAQRRFKLNERIRISSFDRRKPERILALKEKIFQFVRGQNYLEAVGHSGLLWSLTPHFDIPAGILQTLQDRSDAPDGIQGNKFLWFVRRLREKALDQRGQIVHGPQEAPARSELRENKWSGVDIFASILKSARGRQQAKDLEAALERLMPVFDKNNQPTRDALMEAIVWPETNLKENFRADFGLPLVLSFDPELFMKHLPPDRRPHMEPWRVVYVNDREFQGLGVIYGNKNRPQTIIAEGSSSYLTPRPGEVPDKFRASALSFVPLIAETADKTRLGLSPFRGAQFTVVTDKKSPSDKRRILRKLAGALAITGFLGEKLILSAGTGMYAHEMDTVDEAAYDAAIQHDWYQNTNLFWRELLVVRRYFNRTRNILHRKWPSHFKRLKQYLVMPPAAGISERYGGIPKQAWKVQGIGLVAVLHAMLWHPLIQQKYFGGKEPKEVRVTMFGSGTVAFEVVRTIMENYPDMGIKFVGLTDIQRELLSSEGFDLGLLREIITRLGQGLPPTLAGLAQPYQRRGHPIEEILRTDAEKRGAAFGPADIVVLASGQHSFTLEDAVKCRGKIILEANENVATPQARHFMGQEKNGIFFVPFSTANPGKASYPVREILHQLMPAPGDMSETEVTDSITGYAFTNFREILDQLMSRRVPLSKFASWVDRINKQHAKRTEDLMNKIYQLTHGRVTPSGIPFSTELLYEIKQLAGKDTEERQALRRLVSEVSKGLKDRKLPYRFALRLAVHGHVSAEYFSGRAIGVTHAYFKKTRYKTFLENPEKSSKSDRTHAAIFLGIVEHAEEEKPEIVTLLGKTLRDPDYRVRADAARTLGRIGHPRAVPLLLHRLSDPFEIDPKVRQALRWALGQYPVRWEKKLKAAEKMLRFRQNGLRRFQASQKEKLDAGIDLKTELQAYYERLGRAAFTLGVLYDVMGNKRQALSYYYAAVGYYKSAQAHGGIMPYGIQQLIAATYIDLGEKKQARQEILQHIVPSRIKRLFSVSKTRAQLDTEGEDAVSAMYNEVYRKRALEEIALVDGFRSWVARQMGEDLYEYITERVPDLIKDHQEIQKERWSPSRQELARLAEAEDKILKDYFGTRDVAGSNHRRRMATNPRYLWQERYYALLILVASGIYEKFDSLENRIMELITARGNLKWIELLHRGEDKHLRKLLAKIDRSRREEFPASPGAIVRSEVRETAKGIMTVFTQRKRHLASIAAPRLPNGPAGFTYSAVPAAEGPGMAPVIPVVLGMRKDSISGQLAARTVFDAVRESGIDGFSRGLFEGFDRFFVPLALASEGKLSFPVELALEQEAADSARIGPAVDRFFENSLSNLQEAIRRREVEKFAPVIFYSPVLDARLSRFIHGIQAAFEERGDVTGDRFRFHLVTTREHKEALMKFVLGLKTETRGKVRSFVVDGTEAAWKTLAAQIDQKVAGNSQFGSHYGVFFADPAFLRFSEKISAKRTVQSEVPPDFAMALVPALSLYFARTKTEAIDAVSLTQALPEALSPSVTFGMESGIRILPVLVELLARAAAESEIRKAA